MNELDQINAAKEAAMRAKLAKKNLEIVRRQQVEQRLIQTVQDTEDRIVFEQGRALEVVADPE
eukprot:1679224-Prorocentrum_lima.AAC.1